MSVKDRRDYDELRELLMSRGCDIHGRVVDCVNATTRIFNLATQGKVQAHWAGMQRDELMSLRRIGESRVFDAWRNATVDFIDGLIQSTMSESRNVTIRAMCFDYMYHPVVVQMRAAMATAGFLLVAMRQMHRSRPVLCETDVVRSPVGEAADALIRRHHRQLQKLPAD